MPNPLYIQQMLAGRTGMMGMPAPNSPAQRMAAVLQAMQNPQAFVKQCFPDIPQNVINDPNQTFNYLQQTRGQVSQQQVNQAQQMAGQMIQGDGTVR